MSSKKKHKLALNAWRELVKNKGETRKVPIIRCELKTVIQESQILLKVLGAYGALHREKRRSAASEKCRIAYN